MRIREIESGLLAEGIKIPMGKAARRKRRGKTAAAISKASNPLHGSAEGPGQKSELLRIRQAQKQPGLSRGKRRRLAQRERRASKAELVKVLSKAHKRDESVRKNGKMGDMSDVSNSLMSLLDDLRGGASLLDATRGGGGGAVGAAGDERAAASGKKRHSSKSMSNKARSRIAAAEADNFSMVVNHAAFQANPLAAIREHLKNTLGH